ncbi:MAG: DUF4347 domain-containing protein [Cyanobacteriota bacterium]|nr:DUF4347 domain-containing protein [Cyanobacteriota bacterium]
MVLRNKTGIALLPLLGLATFLPPTLAQSIAPTPDGTGTVIQHNGNTYTITGGTQAGTNLFHSFSELGLSPTEIANFLSNPNIQNILGRVTGGNPSIIQGLLQVTGGNSNLLLMNPAGIVFTQGATLNLPGSFTATTADAIGFENGTFSATGNNNTQTLLSAPNQFIFAGNNNGSIVNAAQLEVSQGNLALIGSSVINTGTLTAPNGNITIAAVPDSKAVRINQEGMVLGLEIAPSTLDSGIAGTDIARLLTDPNLQDATGVSIGSNGELRLTGSNLSLDAAGNITLAGSVTGNQVHLAAAGDVNPIGTPETLIRTHDGQYSAPTVTRFARKLTDPNAYIFLDATVPDYESFLYGGQPGTTTTVVVPTENGIEKITETLATPGLSLVDQLHIISEGSEGNFWLGNAFIDSDSIGQYQSQIATWNQGLSVGADILLYACFVALGSSGEALLDTIASYTGADVAGSTNLTGLGGDWILERKIGDIEANVPLEADVLANYGHSLQTFTVTNGDDMGTGSLRQAILDANAATTDPFDEIRFDSGVTQVTLTSAQLDIDVSMNGLVIDGDANGTSNVIIERSMTMGTPDFRIFDITGDNDITFDALTVRNGRVSGSGGGINHLGIGTLTLTNSTVSGNQAEGDGGGIFSLDEVALTNSTIFDNSAIGRDSDGGGIYASVAVTVTDSTISGNSTTGDLSDGGGIFSDSSVIVTGSTILSNSTAGENSEGGGIFSYGSVAVTNSTILGNSTMGLAGEGGGIYASVAVTVTDSTISGNSTTGDFSGGGGIFSNGSVAVTDSTISSNSAMERDSDGGGIYASVAVTVTDSTISGNSAIGSDSEGGGIFSKDAVVLTNSTVSGNQAGSSGGGIYGALGGAINSSTITGNTADSDGDGTGDGGGIGTSDDGTFEVRNSIIAGNFDNSAMGNVYPDVLTVGGGDINGDANNLIGDILGANGTIGTGSDLTFASAGITDISEVLNPLADNGGATQTHALIPGSPALDAGDNNEIPMGVTTDQRGANRTLNTTVDIGAVEMEFALLPSGTPQSTQVETAFATPLSVQLVDTFANRPIAFADLEVTFRVPASGASGVLGNGTMVLTDAAGNAANPFTANATVGSYQVTAEAIGTQAVTFDLENTAIPVDPTPNPTPNPTPDPTPDPTPTVVITTGSQPQTVVLTAPPETNTSPAPQTPPAALSETSLACIAAANPANFAPLRTQLSAIAGLMNAGGGTLSTSLRGFAECGNLASLPGNQRLAEDSLKQALNEAIGEGYDDLVQVRFVNSNQGATVLVEVQPSPQPAFVQEETGEVFYLYEDGNARQLESEAVELYIQQRWPQ